MCSCTPAESRRGGVECTNALADALPQTPSHSLALLADFHYTFFGNNKNGPKQQGGAVKRNLDTVVEQFQVEQVNPTKKMKGIADQLSKPLQSPPELAGCRPVDWRRCYNDSCIWACSLAVQFAPLGAQPWG